MIAFERRQTILRLLQARPGIKVTQLASALQVSEGTVRNDLDALEQEQKLQRVRGGAVLGPLSLPVRSRVEQMEVSAEAKRRIARWACDLVDNGETILLDASTTVLYMVPFLQEHKNLTIVTNGIEAARLLAQNSSNTVILIGGVVSPNGNTITGIVGAGFLNDLHIRTAFVSGVGFSCDMGLTEDNLQEAHLKRMMLAAAGRLVALVDSRKLGKVGLTSVATIDQIAHVFTDTSAAPAVLEALRQQAINLTICGENTVTAYTPHREQHTYKIGFANLSEGIPFAVDVRRSLERAVKELSNIDLVIADNRLSGERALRIADNFIAKGVDLVIEYQLDAMVGSPIMNKFQRAGTPVIAVDIPMVGATYFGVNNFHSGHLGGVALGQWIQRHWQARFDRLIVLEEQRAGALPAARIQGQLEGLQEVIGPVPEEARIVLNSGNTSSVSEAEVFQALQVLPNLDRIAVICFNDDAAIGALHAAQRLRREHQLVIAGQGADRIIRDEIRRPHSRIIGSSAFMPERYGDKLMELALKIFKGESVPPAVYIDHVFIDAGNIDIHYPR